MMQENTNQTQNEEELKIHLPENLESDAAEQSAAIQEKDNTIAALKQEVGEWKDKFIRKVAEFDNYKRRSEQEQQMLFQYAGEHLAVKILSVVDDLERSLQHGGENVDAAKIIQGVQLIYDKFTRILSDQGIKKIESLGKPFDVELHDALMQQPSAEHPDQTVLQEIEAGYMYKDKVIRHAKVIVSSKVEEETPAQNGAEKDEAN